MFLTFEPLKAYVHIYFVLIKRRVAYKNMQTILQQGRCRCRSAFAQWRFYSM